MRLRCLLLVCWIYGSQAYPILMLLYIEALLEVCWAELLNMVTSHYRKRENRALGCRVCRRRDGVAMQLSMLRKK